MALSSGSARVGTRRPKVGDEVGERPIDVMADATGGGDGERPDAIGSEDEPRPQPAMGEAEPDREARDEQQRAEPDEDRPRVAGDRQAGELELAAEGEAQARDGGRDALVDRDLLDRVAGAGPVGLDPDLAGLDESVAGAERADEPDGDVLR